MALVPKEEVAAIECRHVVFCPPPKWLKDDYHFVKEVVTTKDGRKVPQTRMIRNFKRPFWITQKGKQVYKDKKEVEKLENLVQFESTQSQLIPSIARALGNPGFSGSYKMLARSPYIFGSDIPAAAILKRKYADQYPDVNTPYTYSCFDTERDVVKGTDETIMGTITFGNKVYTAIKEDFFQGYANVIPRLRQALEKYLGDYVKKRNIEWEVVLVEKEIDIFRNCFNKAHEWKPDFVGIWNMNYDMKEALKACERAGVHPADIFCDPSVPREYRFFEYKEGQPRFETASGKVKPLKPSERWHTVFTPASFYIVDPMCAYRMIRTGEGEEPSYALDAILEKELGIRKLSFKEAEKYQGIEKHQFLQSNHPIEYVIYNVFDCVSMQELDERTSDITMRMPQMAGMTDLSKFKSQPTRLVTELHFFAQTKGLVMGTTSDNLKTELDDLTVGRDGWITTLPAHLVADNGLFLIEEYPNLRTNIRVQVADLDVSASYPNGGAVANISKATTRRELCYIDGVSDEVRRLCGINLSGGMTNAVEVCTGLFGMPQLSEWLDAWDEDHAAPTEQKENERLAA